MTTDPTYTIADLARSSGVGVRTIRYYVAQGLLPAPGESGPGAHYGQGHRDRLRLTKRLQRQHLPLAEIRARLAELDDDEVATLVAAGEPASSTPATSALDYVRSVLGATEPRPSAQTGPQPSAQVEPPPAGVRPHFNVAAGQMPPAALARPPLLGLASPSPLASLGPPLAAPLPPNEPPSLERSQWERFSLGPNVELHIRRPLSRHEQKRVERLLTIARQVLKEDTP